LKNNDTAESKDFSKSNTSVRKRPDYKNLAEVVGEKDILKYWAAEESYYPTIHINSKDTLKLEFNGQCTYSFPFKMEGDSMNVYWDLIENCTHDIGIKKSFGLKDKPIKGKPFMSLRLINDTTLKAAYKYKEWSNQFNNEYKGYQYLPDTFLSIGD